MDAATAHLAGSEWWRVSACAGARCLWVQVSRISVGSTNVRRRQIRKLDSGMMGCRSANFIRGKLNDRCTVVEPAGVETTAYNTYMI